jgi:hypothetical protein
MEGSLDSVRCINLSYDNIDSREVYVMENGEKIYIYVGRDVDVEVKHSLFGDEGVYRIPVLDTEENATLRKVVEEICDVYDHILPIYIIYQGVDSIEAEFIGNFIEDQLNGIPTYSDYLCEMHFEIQEW